MTNVIQNQSLGFRSLKAWLAIALFASANVLTPVLLHSIPHGGQIFLPLFFFTLIASWQFGIRVGLVVALASPLFSSLLSGMPVAAMLPIVLIKSASLALLAILLRQVFSAKHPLGFALAVLGMQIAGFLSEQLAAWSLAASLTALQIAIPGMLIMTLGGWLFCLVLGRLQSKERGQ